MTIKIGEKIKELRKKSDVTQERFAEYLGVTAQAVSKWEVEGGYPDIEFLPSIANFFDVTIDELMCYDILKNQEKIDGILKQINEHWRKGTAVEFLRNAVQEFPNNHELLYHLANCLKSYGNNGEERLKNVRESISICTRILEDCIDDNLRFRSIQSLSYSYNSIGDKEKALEMANRLPSALNSRESVLAGILDGEEKFKQIVQNISLSWDMLWGELLNLNNSKYNDNAEKKVEIYKKMINITEIMHENKDYVYEHLCFRAWYAWLIDDYIKLEDYDNALDCVEKYAEHCIKFDALPEIFTYTSVIFDGASCPKDKQNDVRNAVAGAKEVLLSGKIYAPLHEHARFKAVITELEKHIV